MHLKTFQLAFNWAESNFISPNFADHQQYFLYIVGKCAYSTLNGTLKEKKISVIYNTQILAYSFISPTGLRFLPNTITAASNTSLSSLLVEMDSPIYNTAINHKII